MGWGGFLDKLLEKLPIQGRVERWKNELENLKKERSEIEKVPLNINSAADRKKAMRLGVIDKRIDDLNQLLRNKATD